MEHKGPSARIDERIKKEKELEEAIGGLYGQKQEKYVIPDAVWEVLKDLPSDIKMGVGYARSSADVLKILRNNGLAGFADKVEAVMQGHDN